MTEPVDEITRAFGAGFVEGVNRSRAVSGVLETMLRGVDAADDAALRVALARVRIGSELQAPSGYCESHGRR